MHQWYPLCGNRLSYGSTGYEIELCTDPKGDPYLLHDPDGRTIGCSHNLQLLKDFTEEQSRLRDEFQVMPNIAGQKFKF